METLTVSKNEKNYASFIHLSAMSKYFIPLGNYILPIILWTTKKNESPYADYHGKQIINFQLSVLLYSIVLFMIAIPTFLVTLFSTFSIHDLENGNLFLNEATLANITGAGIVGIFCIALFGALKIIEFFLIIYGAIKANEGTDFRYPITINFIK